MNFREKSTVAQIVTIVGVFGFFLVRHWGRLLTREAAIAGIVAIIVVMPFIAIVAHIAIALRTRPEKEDERDIGASLRGSRNGYRALAVTVWCVLFLTITEAPPGVLCYALLGAFALAEVIRLSSQLYYYRLG